VARTRRVALALVAVAASIALMSCQSTSAAVKSPVTTTTTIPATTTSTSTTTTTVPPTTTVPSTTTTTRPAPPPTTVPAITPGIPRPGSRGPAVLAMQQSLTALGYWLGTPNGYFSSTTQQAVWALQKAAGLPRTGEDDAATAAALAAGTLPTPQSTTGYVIEVNLKTDLVMFVNNGKVVNVLNTSTGGGYVFYDQGVRNVAITPQGHFTTYRVINGNHMSSLGLLFRPRYFVGGFAIHGDSYVPARPVSHGCVRVSDAAIDWIWATNNDPIGTAVWVY